MENLLEELFKAQPESLEGITEDGEKDAVKKRNANLEHLKNALQLLVLRNTKRMQFVKGLAAIPGFRGFLRGAVERNTAAYNMAQRASQFQRGVLLGRRFARDIVVADGGERTSLGRAADPRAIQTNGSRSFLGNSPESNIDARDKREEAAARAGSEHADD